MNEMTRRKFIGGGCGVGFVAVTVLHAINPPPEPLDVPDDVNTGDGLTAEAWNNLVVAVKELRERQP